MKEYIESKRTWFFSVILAILLCFPPISAGSITRAELVKPHVSFKHKRDTSRILFIIKQRIKDKQLIAKTKEKLLTLSDSEISLIASLCDRISKNDNTAGAELAFSLVAALIILS